MIELASFPADAPLAAKMAALSRDGAVILTNLMSDADLDSLLVELKPYLDVAEFGRESFSGFRTTRTGALAARSKTVRAAILDPHIRELCDQVLLPNCSRYQVNVTHIIRILPGEVTQIMHRDRASWSYLKGMEPQLNTIWALTDFTKENGATQLVPGSWKWPEDRKAKPDEIAYAVMKRGSALVYTGSVLHCGGANRSDQPRIGMNLTYCLNWLRQEENQYLSCPPEIARDFEPELQALMGYASGPSGLGFYTPPLAPDGGPAVYAIEHAVGAKRQT